MGYEGRTLPHIELCVAAQLFYPVYAGGSLQFLHYLPGLKARQVHARVFAGTPILSMAQLSGVEVTWQARRPGEMLPMEMVNGVPVHRVRLPDASSIQRSIVYGRTLVRFCQQPDYRPDLFQILSTPRWCVPWLLRLRYLNIPTVHAHALAAEFSSNPVKRALQRHSWRLSFQLVDCVVVNSTVMRERLRNLDVTTSIEVIPTGVDLQRFRPAANSAERQKIRQPLGIGQEEPVIVTVGAVEPRKGTDLLLAAWVQLAPRCSRSHLVIIGPRSDLADPAFEDFRRKLEDLVVASGAPDRVHFVGHVENVEEYLRAADVFVFTSWREGVPNAVLEAMASRLPVITTPFLGLPDEFGQPDEHYLLVDRDPNLLSSLIEKVLEEKALRAKIGLSARQWVEAQMDVEMTINQLANLYRELVNRSNKGKRRTW
jgi:glycosyltransferase involved in cell wall biosynthesis